MKKIYLSIFTLLGVSISLVAQTQLQDINTGSGDAYPESFCEFNGDLYFSATNDNGDGEIYKYDGSTVTLIPDVNTDQALKPGRFTVFNGKMIFTYMDGQNIEGLWEYDGTNTPTLIADINPAGNDGRNTPFAVYNNTLYFAGNNGTDGDELWAYDGTNTPSMVMNINPNGNSRPFCFTEFQGELYFIANTGTQRDFFKVNSSGNVNVVAPGNFNGYSHSNLPEANGKLYLAGETTIGDENSNTLFEFSGSGIPTAVSCGLGTGETHYARYAYQDFNGTLYIQAVNATTWSTEFWSFDYTNAASPTPQELRGVGTGTIIGNLVYYASDYSLGQAEITRYDGVTATALMDLNTTANAVYDAPVIYQNKLVFSGTDGTSGFEPWEFADPILSIDELNSNLMTIYPNPGSDLINIQSHENVEQVFVFDMMGNLVQSETSTEFSVSKLAQGTYTISVQTALGTTQQRFVKM